MKPLSRNGAINLLAVVEGIVVIALLVLWAMGKMSNVAFAVSMFTVLFLSFVTAIFIMFKYQGAPDENEIDKVAVTRTRQGTIIEAVTGMLVVGAWIAALATRRFIGDDGGILYRKIFDMFMMTSFIAFLLIDVYTPSDLHFVGKLTNAKQVYLGVRMNRILAILFALYLIIYVIPSLHVIWLAIGLLVVGISIYIYYRILIHKAK
jgi:hypothetical protein